MSIPLGKVISGRSGRRFVIGDIHGCYLTFRALLDQLSITSSDHLFLLGDYVNKGPASRKVLDHIIGLQGEYQVYPLIGNHDLMALDYFNGDKERLNDQYCDDLKTLTPSEQAHYSGFLSQLPYYFVLEEHLLVHAGFDFNLPNPFLGKEAMVNIRDFQYNLSRAQNKTIVHGHYPRALDFIRSRISKQSRMIPLDNGCVYKDTPEQGNLLCLELRSRQLVVQPNCEY